MAWSQGDRDDRGNIQVDFVWGNMPMQPSSRGTDRAEGSTFADVYDLSQFWSDSEQAEFGVGRDFPDNEADYSLTGTERIGDAVIDYGWWNNYPGPREYEGWD